MVSYIGKFLHFSEIIIAQTGENLSNMTNFAAVIPTKSKGRVEGSLLTDSDERDSSTTLGMTESAKLVKYDGITKCLPS